jgi:hypothetical protein
MPIKSIRLPLVAVLAFSVWLHACCKPCPPPPTAPKQPLCSKTDLPMPRACPTSTEPGGWGYNHPFIEGVGLERLRFKADGGRAYPLAEGIRLTATSLCPSARPLTVKVTKCGPPGKGAQPCVVQVEQGAGICMGAIGRIEDSKRDRGVMVVNGYWDLTGKWQNDSTVVTLACNAAMGFDQSLSADGAITSCAQTWRYEPDDHRNEFLACIRAVRADYCGDGVAHTMVSTDFDLNDGVHKANCSDTRAFEADWSPDGAVCFAHPRWDDSGIIGSSCESAFTQHSDGKNCRADGGQARLSTRSRGHVCDVQGQIVDHSITDADPACQTH